MRDFLQIDRLLRQPDQVLDLEYRRRHAGEGGELVDHAPDVAHLANDRVGASGEHLGVALDLGEVLALDALGRKLNRRQRVLYLVGDPARDVGPGGGTLGGDERGDVVEGDDEALERVAKPLGADADEQVSRAAVAYDRDLVLAAPVGPFHRLVHDRAHLGHGVGESAADQLVGAARQQLERRAVGILDAALGIEPDDAGGHARQYRFGEPSPRVELAVGLDEFAALGSQLLGHTVEGAAQAGDLVVARAFLDARVEVAPAHLLGGGDEVAYRPRELGREGEAEPHRGEQQQQRDDAEYEGESYLDLRSLALEALILGDGVLGALHIPHRAGVHEAPDEQIGVDEHLEANQRAHPVIGIAGEDDHLAVVGLVHRLERNALQEKRKGQPRAPEHAPVAAKHHDLGQRPERRLGYQEPVEHGGAADQRAPGAVDIVGHGERIGADHLAMLVEIRLGHRERCAEGRLDPLAEPRFDAEVEEQDREHRDDDRRSDGDDAEQRHHPRVQPRSGRAPAAFEP